MDYQPSRERPLSPLERCGKPRFRSLILFRLDLSSIATGRFNSPGPPFLSKAMSLACTLSVSLTSTINLASHVCSRRMENLAR
jgi:hypothetical protein